MKKSIFVLLFNLIALVSFGQGDQTIAKIRENFQTWQPIIESELNSSTQLFHYAWGENYQEDEWYSNEQTSEDKFLFQKVRLIEKSNLGTFVEELIDIEEK